MLVYPDGREIAFAGWIELTAALEEARHPLDVVAQGKASTLSDADGEPTSDDGLEPAEAPS